MYQWFFIVSLVCVATIDDTFLTFDPQETTLAECIQHHLVSIDGHYKSTQTANVTAHFSAKRFRGKTMSNDVFNARFYSFFGDLRNYRISHNISKDQLSEQMRQALKQALVICGNTDSFSSTNTKNLDEKKPKEVEIEDHDLISFSPNKYLLSECIENHLKLTGRPEFLLEDGFTEAIADIVARRHSGKVSSRKIFYKRNKDLFYKLQVKRISHNLSIDKLSNDLGFAVVQATEDCAMGKLPLANVPMFKMETSEIALLLNLILVKWPDDLRYMIQSRNGRAVLRRYANDAWAALISELNVYQNNTQIFRLILRSFWKNRAQQMYDASSADLPYIVHRYTLNYPIPHMIISNYETFLNRKIENFSDRNPLTPQSYLHEILNIYKSDLKNDVDKIGIFADYINNGMTSAEYYFEKQINQFYRILFFFLELRATGMCTDNDDVYNGPLPYFWIPEHIQAIIYDDNVYRNYLHDERHFYEMLLGSSTKNMVARSLIENSWILEENLILLRSNIASTSYYELSDQFSNITTIKTTTQSLKRKDDVWKNKNGKCFPLKKTKMNSFSNNSSNFHKHPDNMSLNQISNLSFQENNEYSVINLPTEDSIKHFELYASQEQDKIKNNSVFGYLTLSEDDFNQLQFHYEDSFFLEIALVDFSGDEHSTI